MEKRGIQMINGVAIIAVCMFSGFFAGDIIGEAIGIGSNVGGVGFAMFLLLLATDKMKERGKLSKDISEGIGFWQAMYIPIVIAMTATQDVVAAVSSGFLAIAAGIAVVLVGFILVWLSSFLPGSKVTEEERAPS